MKPRVGIGAVIGTIILISLINWTCNAQAYDDPKWGLTIELALQKYEINSTQNIEPYTFDGWVNWTGVAVIPITVHLSAQCDIGDVFLSQYDFTFQLPDSIPFDGVIPIGPRAFALATPQMTMSGYIEQGGLQYEIPSTTYLVPIYYNDENETIDETLEHNDNGSDLLSVGIIGYVAVSGITGITLIWAKKRKRKR